MSRDRADCPFCGRSISLSPKGREFASHDTARSPKGRFCAGSHQTLAEATEDAIPEERLLETIRAALLTHPAAAEAFEILCRRHDALIELEDHAAW